MTKTIEAPYGYDCPYQRACPHLQGLSTQWMWLRHQEDIERGHEHRLREADLLGQLRELEGENHRLREENAQLKAKLNALHQAQFKASNKPRESSGSDQPAGLAKRKPGPPIGHPPWTRRQPDHVDRTVPVPAPQQCPHCQCRELSPWEEHSEHLQEDIVLCPTTWVVCYDHQQAWCPCCRRPVMQAGPGEMIGSYIGPVAKSTALHLRHRIGISCRHVQQIMEELFGLPMTMAAVIGFERSAADRGEGPYEDLHQKVQASDYAHADETSWRVNGENYWLWYAGHEQLAYFHIDRHRSGEVAQAVMGKQYGGILNTDDYAAYNGIEAAGRQSCLAHPLRKVREALELIKTVKEPAVVDRSSQNFLEQAKEFLGDACQIGAQLREADASLGAPDSIQAALDKDLEQLCKKPLAWQPAEQLRCRLWKQRERLFTFVDHPEVQPTNNQAEQSLRGSVILRKITFGNRSEEGARRHAILRSLFMTAHRQGRDGRSAIQELLTQPADVAQKAFYREPSSEAQCPTRSPSNAHSQRTRPDRRSSPSNAREPPK